MSVICHMSGKGQTCKGTDMKDGEQLEMIKMINYVKLIRLQASTAADSSLFLISLHFSTYGLIRGGDYQGCINVICHVNKTHFVQGKHYNVHSAMARSSIGGATEASRKITYNKT